MALHTMVALATCEQVVDVYDELDVAPGLVAPVHAGVSSPI